MDISDLQYGSLAYEASEKTDKEATNLTLFQAQAHTALYFRLPLKPGAIAPFSPAPRQISAHCYNAL